MNTREDFEIYTFNKNGHVWYGFKVDYFGRYSAPTEEQILKIRRNVKRRVKARLEWVERENQKYYARLAEEERRRALFLKEAKQQKLAALEAILNRTRGMTAAQKKARIRHIDFLIEQGFKNQDIMKQMNVSWKAVMRRRIICDKEIPGGERE